MPIITISRGSYHHGKSIAEKLAKKLGYQCFSRDQILQDLDEFQLPEIKMVRCLHDAFSALDRMPHGKKRFSTTIRSAILQIFQEGNVVYHGLFAHHFVRDISHVLKIRIIADTANRVADEMTRENISLEQAHSILKKDDEERRKWGMFLYGIDVMDPETYNLIIRIGHLSEDDAVDIIASASSLPSFQETPESKAALVDSAMEALVSRKLFDFPLAAVVAINGQLTISLKVPEGQKEIIRERIDHMLLTVPSLTQYTLQFEPYY
ncbi:MAG: cytidylate kinase-like family protein [Proteobacteria bacterium]|nr:cytidylate kinase-like family protein [Pseudomonadota bacterium]